MNGYQYWNTKATTIEEKIHCQAPSLVIDKEWNREPKNDMVIGPMKWVRRGKMHAHFRRQGGRYSSGAGSEVVSEDSIEKALGTEGSGNQPRNSVWPIPLFSVLRSPNANEQKTKSNLAGIQDRNSQRPSEMYHMCCLKKKQDHRAENVPYCYHCGDNSLSPAWKFR